MTTVNISGIDKAELLVALVNAARPLGMGVLQDDGKPMTKEEAEERINGGRWHDQIESSRRILYFDYVKGRPIKCDLSGDTLDTRLYDRDQGPGAGERVVAKLRAASIDPAANAETSHG